MGSAHKFSLGNLVERAAKGVTLLLTSRAGLRGSPTALASVFSGVIQGLEIIDCFNSLSTNLIEKIKQEIKLAIFCTFSASSILVGVNVLQTPCKGDWPSFVYGLGVFRYRRCQRFQLAENKSSLAVDNHKSLPPRAISSGKPVSQ